ncbi:MAG: lasso peptide biosynthesis B2 protein [Thermodesulfobacteriota bacterium]
MIKNKIKKFSNLRIEKKLIVIESSIILCIVKLLIKIIGLNATYNILKKLPSLPVKEKISTIYIESLWSLVLATSRSLPIKTKCIEESISLWLILRTRGIKSHLKIGIHNSDNFKAHAWVETYGKSIGKSEDIDINFSAFDYKFFNDEI